VPEFLNENGLQPLLDGCRKLSNKERNGTRGKPSARGAPSDGQAPVGQDGEVERFVLRDALEMLQKMHANEFTTEAALLAQALQQRGDFSFKQGPRVRLCRPAGAAPPRGAATRAAAERGGLYSFTARPISGQRWCR
jgi:hypothetical protein